MVLVSIMPPLVRIIGDCPLVAPSLTKSSALGDLLTVDWRPARLAVICRSDRVVGFGSGWCLRIVSRCQPHTLGHLVVRLMGCRMVIELHPCTHVCVMGGLRGSAGTVLHPWAHASVAERLGGCASLRVDV